MSSEKPKKIVITPEEVANTPSRKPSGRKTNQTQVIELDPNATVTDAENSGVTFIQVNELGEVSSIDGSILDQNIAIQIDDNAANTGVLEGTIALHEAPAEVDEEATQYLIQSPETYRERCERSEHPSSAKFRRMTEMPENATKYCKFCGILRSSSEFEDF